VLGKKSTTVTVDKTLSDLLALRFGHTPRSEDAHFAVRAYLQEKLDETNDPGRTSVSQWLRQEVLLDLVEKKLSDKYWPKPNDRATKGKVAEHIDFYGFYAPPCSALDALKVSLVILPCGLVLRNHPGFLPIPCSGDPF